MGWRIEIAAAAEKDLAKLDKQAARRITKFLCEKVSTLRDPHSIGAALQGKRFGEFWKYRVDDYRIISKIQDDILLILVVLVGHRGKVYRHG